MTEQPLWQPAPERVAITNMTRFARDASLRWGRTFKDYAELHRWSVEAPEEFWISIWDWTGVIGTGDTDPVVVDQEQMPGARWFPKTRLNFAQNLLRRQDAGPALIFQAEDKVTRCLSYAELHGQVARLADALKQAGVVPGDRVCGFMPNMPETVAAMLASASVGAVWSSCSPDFGVQGVLDRFGQISPKVLFSADGYWYNGKTHDSLEKLREIANGLPSLEHTVVVPLISDKPELSANPGTRLISDFETDATQIDFENLPFDHPLYIMYSSGTTGVPKCIVHGAGGLSLIHI